MLLAAGCASWQVVRQADPNPFSNASSFAVAEVRFDDALVQGAQEGDFVAGLSTRKRDVWKSAKGAMDARFLASLKHYVQGYNVDRDREYEQFLIVPIVTAISPGYDRARATTMDVKVEVRSIKQQGRVLDAFTTQIKASGKKAAEAFREAGDDLGQVVATYLNGRVL